MPVTTQAQEYARLRSYLTPYIKGANVDAVLNALASGNSSFLINQVAAVNDNLYIATAVGTYLDQRLAEFGITRPSAVGMSDDVFRQIGIQVKNRKQVRDLINNILDIIFGDELVRATSDSSIFEPYALQNGDTLIVNFDENTTTPIQFVTADFENIAAATAQEVADAISKYMSSLGLTGSAIAKNNGNGNFVEIISSTIGPASSVTVLGGRAQNALKFSAPVAAGGNMATQWTISLQGGGIVRFTWSGGPNPQLGKVESGDYVNIFDGGFSSSANEGSYPIIDSVGGVVGSSYFEVLNPLGTSGGVTQGTDDAILFYDPVRKALNSNQIYAAVYQTQSQTLQIFLPATTQVIRRSRIGSAHIHYPNTGTFIFNTNPSTGDSFSITTTETFLAGADFAIGLTPKATAENFVEAVNTITGLVAVLDSADAVDNVNGDTTNGSDVLTNVYPIANVLVGASITGLGIPSDTTIVSISGTNMTISAPATVTAAATSFTVAHIQPVALIQSDLSTITLTIIYGGGQNVIASGPMGDQISSVPNQQGPYSYDLSQPFTISATDTVLTHNLDGTMSRVVQVANSTDFPDGQGYLIFDYGAETQEGPVPYISRPSDNTLLISPAYTIQTPHADGSSVSLVAVKAPVILAQDGTDYEFFVTDVVSGRVYAQNLINSIAATGINIVFTILYPADIGLGKWGTIYTENPYVWGP